MLNKIKIIFTTLLIVSLLCIHAVGMNTVEARIPVTIEGGGIAVIVPTVNSPIPNETEITVKDGETGCFIIHITEPGTYSYIISVEKEVSGAKRYTPEYYDAIVSGLVNDEGELYTVTTVTRRGGDNKTDLAEFKVDKGWEPEGTTVSGGETTTGPTPPDTITPPPGTTEPGTRTESTTGITTEYSTDRDSSTPNTGDDTKLDLYLILAIAASAGLFALSAKFYTDTKRLITKE